VNRAPTLELGESLGLLEGEVRTVPFSASDPDGDAVTVTFTDLPAWITREQDALRLAPQAGHAGAYTLTATVSDGALTATDTLDITVQTAPTGTMRVNGGEPYTRHATVDVQFQVIPGAGASALTEVAFSRDGVSFDAPVPYAAGFSDVALADTGDGLKTLWARIRDDAGHQAVLSAQVVLDRVAPTVSASAPAWVGSTTVPLSISVLDTSPITQACYSNDGLTFEECGPLEDSRSWVITAGDGAKSVTVRVADAAGNLGEGEVQLSLDTAPPTGSVAIAEGRTATRVRQVLLSLSVTDASSGTSTMAFSADGGGSWSEEAPFASSGEVQLPDLDGAHALRARVRDRAGNVATFDAGSIRLDRVAPSGTLVVAGTDGNGFIGSTSVSLALTSSDVGSGVSAMAFANDTDPMGAAEPVATTRAWTLSGGDGSKVVRMRLTDAAGNTRDVQTTVKLDTTPPTGALTIQGGAAWTTAQAVSLQLEATDHGGSGLVAVCVKNVESPPPLVDPCWKTYDSPIAHTLAIGDGVKTVHAFLRDRMAHIAHVSASIVLDTAAPVAVIQDMSASHRSLHVRWAEATDPTGITGYEVCHLDFADSSGDMRCEPVGMALEHTVTPVPNGRSTFVFVFTTDGAGHRGASVGLAMAPDFPFRETQRKPTAGILHDVHLISAPDQIAVGEQGQIFRTTDRWTSHQRVDPMVDVDLYAIAGEGDVLHAVGANGTIVRSTDGGSRWRRSIGPAAALRDVEVVRIAEVWPTRRWVAVGDNATVATLDRSRAPQTCGQDCPQEQWQVQTLPGGSTLRSVAYSPETDVMIAVGDNGSIQRSTNRGTSWTSMSSPVTTQLTAVTAMPGGTSFYAVTASGQLLLGAGGGVTWSVVTGLSPGLPASGVFRAMKADAGGRLYLAHEAASGPSRIHEITPASLATRVAWSMSEGAPRGLDRDVTIGRVTVVGTQGWIQSSLDAHASTPSTVSPTTGSIAMFRGLAPGRTGSSIWAVGENAVTLHDTANGAAWTPRTGPSTGTRYDVAMLPSGVAFAVGNSGSVWRNASSPSAWTEVGVSTANLRGVSCVRNDLCYAVGSTAGILKFNGTSWIVDFLDPVSTETYLAVATYLDGASQVRGIAITQGGAVRTNQNQVWTHRAGVSATQMTAVAARPSGVALMVGENGRIHRSTNHGVTWSDLTGAVGSTALYAVLWARDDVWFAAGASGRIYRSDDDGLTWTALQTHSTRVIRALGHRALTIGGSVTDYVWAAGAGGSILRSVSGGR